MISEIEGKVVVPGRADGKLLISDEPISFWGGYDQNSGEIIDRRHPLCGENAAGCILALPFSKGSSTGTAVLLEAIRNDKSPAAIITTGVDTFFALASIVAKEMYDSPIPIIALKAEDFSQLKGAERVTISDDGDIHLEF